MKFSRTPANFRTKSHPAGALPYVPQSPERNMPRIFTALEIPRDVALALSMLRGGLPGARWIDAENYHVTLRFIGDVDDTVAHEVASLLPPHGSALP